jgi:VacB/RNase II family 3'-5' exoribonuclease
MNHGHHVDLQAAAKQSMLEHGFQPDFSPAVAEQLAEIAAARTAINDEARIRDLREVLWSSIDNDTSRDLDQLEYVEQLDNGSARVMIAVADVDAIVKMHSAIDDHAERETTTVYAGVRNFSMLPEELSTGLTSLLEDEERLAVVTEFAVDAQGGVSCGRHYRARVRNHAKLTYNAVGAWLDGEAEAPAKLAASPALQAQLRLQDETAQRLRRARQRHGALNLETIETHPVILKDQIIDIEPQQKNRATELIEDFMIGANECVAKTLEHARITSIRRVVKTPKRWDRIVELAEQSGTKLPPEPDARALNEFLTERKAADPDHFPDLSVAVVKLMGPGEYVIERPDDPPQGHFGLAVEDYTHSTAPNRRFADLATQRIVKALIAGAKPPYEDAELAHIAQNCTVKEDGARKVEREMRKRIAAQVMSSRIGQRFDAIVVGVNNYGVFVRVLQPHLEGMLVEGQHGADVGDRLHVKLVRTDVERGFIDFVRV